MSQNLLTKKCALCKKPNSLKYKYCLPCFRFKKAWRRAEQRRIKAERIAKKLNERTLLERQRKYEAKLRRCTKLLPAKNRAKSAIVNQLLKGATAESIINAKDEFISTGKTRKS